VKRSSGSALRDELTFTSFRHGGFTEAGDANLTDQRSWRRGGQVAQGAAKVRQADHESGSGRGEKATCGANEWGHLSE